MLRRSPRASSFGTVVPSGNPTSPFAIRWREGNIRRKKSGFKTRKAAKDGLEFERVRAQLTEPKASADTFGVQPLRLLDELERIRVQLRAIKASVDTFGVQLRLLEAVEHVMTTKRLRPLRSRTRQ